MAPFWHLFIQQGAVPLKEFRTLRCVVRCTGHGGFSMGSRFFVVVGLAVLLTACVSSKPEESFEMAITADSLSVQLSREMVIGLLEDGLDTTFDCDTEPDSELRELLEPLARRRYASSTIGEGDDRVVARRRGSKLDLTIGDRHAAHIRAKMSWEIAECLLGRDTNLEEALGNGGITVKLTTETGAVVQAVLR